MIQSPPLFFFFFFFLMIRRPPRSTLDRSSAASDVYKRQAENRPEWRKYLFMDDLEDEVKVMAA